MEIDPVSKVHRVSPVFFFEFLLYWLAFLIPFIKKKAELHSQCSAVPKADPESANEGHPD